MLDLSTEQAAMRVAAALDVWMKLQDRVASGDFPELEELDAAWKAVTEALEAWRNAR